MVGPARPALRSGRRSEWGKGAQQILGDTLRQVGHVLFWNAIRKTFRPRNDRLQVAFEADEHVRECGQLNDEEHLLPAYRLIQQPPAHPSVRQDGCEIG